MFFLPKLLTSLSALSVSAVDGILCSGGGTVAAFRPGNCVPAERR